MRTALLVVSILAVLIGTAAAGEIWKYRDPVSQRDVFVNKLDQVPAAYRARAQLMVADGVLVNSAAHDQGGASASAPRGTVIFGDKGPSNSTEALKSAVRQAVAKDLSLHSPTAAAVTAMDTALVRAGKPPITPAETNRLARLMDLILVAFSAAGLVSLVSWIGLMIHAWRHGRHGWAVLIFFIHLLGLLYVYRNVDRRWFRWASLLCYLAPALVGVAAAWQLRSWFMDISIARG